VSYRSSACLLQRDDRRRLSGMHTCRDAPLLRGSRAQVSIAERVLCLDEDRFPCLLDEVTHRFSGEPAVLTPSTSARAILPPPLHGERPYNLSSICAAMGNQRPFVRTYVMSPSGAAGAQRQHASRNVWGRKETSDGDSAREEIC
jgi:hypothetical protein